MSKNIHGDSPEDIEYYKRSAYDRNRSETDDDHFLRTGEIRHPEQIPALQGVMEWARTHMVREAPRTDAQRAADAKQEQHRRDDWWKHNANASAADKGDEYELEEIEDAMNHVSHKDHGAPHHKEATTTPAHHPVQQTSPVVAAAPANAPAQATGISAHNQAIIDFDRDARQTTDQKRARADKIAENALNGSDVHVSTKDNVDALIALQQEEKEINGRLKTESPEQQKADQARLADLQQGVSALAKDINHPPDRAKQLDPQNPNPHILENESNNHLALSKVKNNPAAEHDREVAQAERAAHDVISGHALNVAPGEIAGDVKILQGEEQAIRQKMAHESAADQKADAQRLNALRYGEAGLNEAAAAWKKLIFDATPVLRASQIAQQPQPQQPQHQARA